MTCKNQLENVQMEIAIMKKLQHPNLIQLHEVIDDDENDKLYMGKAFLIMGQLWIMHKTVRYSSGILKLSVSELLKVMNR